MPRSRSRSPGRRGGERTHRRSRSRSRSRERRRHRHRSRSPGGGVGGGGGGGGSSRHHRKHSSRSRSPTSSHRRRDRSKSPDIFNKPSSSKSGRAGEPEVTTGATNPDLLSPEMQIPVDGEVTQEAIDMIQLMGFSGFDTTKGKTHTDGSVKAHGASIQVKRKYRQYMNRRGGFNRPLDKVA